MLAKPLNLDSRLNIFLLSAEVKLPLCCQTKRIIVLYLAEMSTICIDKSIIFHTCIRTNRTTNQLYIDLTIGFLSGSFTSFPKVYTFNIVISY